MPDARNQEPDAFLTTNLPGDSAAIAALRAGISRINRWHRLAAGRVHCTLLTGETGTGKFRLAKLMVQHDDWCRQGGSDVPNPEVLAAASANMARVLLTALPDTLAESELFGHVRGAFTGADKERDGVFSDDEVRNVLLDEVGDASGALQGKLLEVIEDRTYRKLGAKPSETLKAEARIILATRADLHALVEEGKFREDLYWRIMPFRLHIPPLRERRDEIPTLIRRMIAEHVRGLNLEALDLPASPALSADEFAFAQEYPWPGNLRQLSDSILAWLIRGRGADFRQVVESGPQGFGRGPRNVIQELVKGRLGAVLAGRRSPFGKVGDVWKEIEREVKSALYQCCVESGDFDGQNLTAIFSDQKLENIRSSLSTCREEKEQK